MYSHKFLIKFSIILLVIAFLISVALPISSQEIAQNDPYNTAGGSNPSELTSGAWILTDVEQKAYNEVGITKWEKSGNEIVSLCQWKDILDIIHTVNAGFKWMEPSSYLKPGSLMEFQASYINKEYSTTTNLKTGIRVFFDRKDASYKSNSIEAVYVLNVSKYNKYYSSEDKREVFTVPKYLFDDSNECVLIVDCYVGGDHYVTKYTYRYQP
ncbi:MAG: hypothetical protein N2510_08720 [Ignavibacteria bacterium]|nr:hypothetical protein [Ignavibacteria bacterium]